MKCEHDLVTQRDIDLPEYCWHMRCSKCGAECNDPAELEETSVSNEFEKVYIGDGVYARWDGFSVLLETERDTGTHYIYLEPQHVKSLAMLIASEPRIAKRTAGQG